MSNESYSEQFRVVAKKWVDADAAATILEDTRSSILSQRMQDLLRNEPGMAINKAETTVKASEEWQNWITGMVEARKQANLLKVQLEYLRMKFHEWQSHEATKRTEARL